MLKAGANSYVTIAQADEYVGTYYTPYAPARVIWSVLDDAEKESYLLTSLAEIEALPFVGRKYRPEQELAFPRRREAGGWGPLPWFRDCDDSEVPEEVRQAQTKNALAILLKECMAQTDKQFMTMQSLGVMKNIKYNKREAGDIGLGDELKGEGGESRTLTGKNAERLLRHWFGAFRV